MVIDAGLPIDSVEIFDRCVVKPTNNSMEEMWAEIASLVDEDDEVTFYFVFSKVKFYNGETKLKITITK